MVAFLAWRLRRARAIIQSLRSSKQSMATRHGQAVEQFAPLLDAWPWPPGDFRFLGSPIDGVQFNDDGVVLVEIKSGDSRLSARQRAIRDHVRAGRVSWQEIRV